MARRKRYRKKKGKKRRRGGKRYGRASGMFTKRTKSRWTYGLTTAHGGLINIHRQNYSVFKLKQPLKMFATFKACRIFNHTMLATVNNTLMVIKGNSLFAPFGTAPNADATVAYHFASEWDNFYNNQKAKSSKIYVVVSALANVVDNYRVGVLVSDSATVLGTGVPWTDVCDDPRWMLMPLKFAVARVSNNKDLNTHFKYGSSVRSIHQGTVFSNAQFQSAIGADPSSKIFYHVVLFNATNAALTADDTMQVKCDLYLKTQLSGRDTSD